MKLIISGIVLSLILTGCSSQSMEQDNDNQQIVESEVALNPAPKEEESTKLEEKTGSGESTAFNPYTSTATVTRIGDDIINVELEEFLEDGTSKNESSKAGVYSSPDYTKGEFYQQVDSLEAYIIENDQFPALTNGSDVDGVSGASVNLSGFEEAYLIALENSK